MTRTWTRTRTRDPGRADRTAPRLWGQPPVSAAPTSAAPASRLAARNLRLGYGNETVVADLSLDIPDAGFTVIVGPNACGKSTLLKALARTQPLQAGMVLLDGVPISSMRSRAVSQQLAMLPQCATAPDAITVRDLVGRGRFPHQSFLRQWSRDDERAVHAALAATNITALADRDVGELSGGQRQRAWIAMVLAQQTELVLLDEPTTFLDIAHQHDVLELCSRLHADGRTLVAVLHDLNQAARYATHLVVMKSGAIVAQGEPSTVLTAELVEEVFGLACVIIDDPETGTPLVVPKVKSGQPG